MTSAQCDKATKEVVLLSSLRHPCIVEYRGSFLQDDTLHILMEYCAAGDLAAHIARAAAEGRHFEEARILDWLAQLAAAISFVHKRHVLHRDLKPGNVFLTSDERVRLGDFGIARVLDQTMDLASTVRARACPCVLAPVRECLRAGARQ